VAVEYVLSRGQADRGDYVVAGTVGALPGGLGARGMLNLGSKLSKLRYFSRPAGDRLGTIGMGLVHPSSGLRQELQPDIQSVNSMTISSRGVVSILAVAGHHPPVNPYGAPRHKPSREHLGINRGE
jgi:hypothetical protein